MGLENLKSIFQKDLNNNVEEYISNRPVDKFDTKLFNTPPRPTIHIATNPTDFSTAVGNNESPFTPLNQLGESFLDGLSWRKLYNPNHTPKNDPKHKGLTPISYGVNVNRDKLNIRNPEDGRFGFAGSARTSVISAVGKFLGQGPTQGSDTTALLRDTGKEPYIVSNIPKSNTDLTSGRIINSNFLDRGLPIERSLTDSVRVAKFLTSPAGLLFIGKQNLLGLQQIPLTQDLNRTQLFNAGARDFGAKFNLSYKAFYNPLSSLISTFGRAGGGPAGKISKTEPGLAGLISSIPGLDAFGDVFDSAYPKFQTENYSEGSQLANIIEFGRAIDLQFAPKTLFESDLRTTDNNPRKDSKFGDGKLFLGNKNPYSPDLTNDGYSIEDTFRPRDESSDSKFGGDIQTLLPFGAIKQKSEEELKENKRDQYEDKLEDAFKEQSTDWVQQKNGMPFYFKDMRDGAFVSFRAYIEGLTENIAPQYTSTQYIGRSEPVYVYGMAERDINFTLKIFAQTKKELSSIYKKMNRLTSMCYPEYFTDETVNYGNRMKPPLTKLRMGELFGTTDNELMGYIKSLSYNIDQSSPYEVDNGKRVPMHIIATIGYQVIHSTAPQLKGVDGQEDYKYYGYVGDTDV